MKLFDRKSALVQGIALSIGASLWAAPVNSPTTPQAPTGAQAKPATGSGNLGEQKIVGTSKEKLDVGKFDPPAAFNLEDIQNFPEDRLMPVLNNPLTFEEGRDFTTMMDFQEDQLYHPWLPEISKAPFLNMKITVDKPPKEWSFAIIDQAGATVAKQDGKGNPPAGLAWNGEDSVRDHVAVDTVYIPQLATTDKEGYHHTYMGQPVQFSSLMYKDHDRTVIELSSKRLFQEKKADFSKEADILLEKVTDVLREEGQHHFAIQPYDNDPDLAAERQKALKAALAARLYIPADSIATPPAQGADKRGIAMAIVVNGGGQ